jgi:hypothetical protein
VDDEVLHTFAVVGPLDELPGLIRGRFGDLADRFSLSRPARVDDERWAGVLEAFHRP